MDRQRFLRELEEIKAGLDSRNNQTVCNRIYTVRDVLPNSCSFCRHSLSTEDRFTALIWLSRNLLSRNFSACWYFRPACPHIFSLTPKSKLHCRVGLKCEDMRGWNARISARCTLFPQPVTAYLALYLVLPRVLEYSSTTRVVNYLSNFLLLEYSRQH